MIIDRITTTTKKAGSEYHTACPFCGGKDRFVLFQGDNRAWCRRCNWSGDEIKFIMETERVGYRDACDKLGIDPRPATPRAAAPRRALSVSTPREHAHNVQAWRAEADRLTTRAFHVLMDDMLDNGTATQWLKSRGIHTVRARCGYIPTTYRTTWAGVDVFVPAGFLLAWYDHPDLPPYKLNVRRLNPSPNEKKYHMLAGSENGLYNAHLIRYSTVVMLTEGELDALSVMQQTNCTVPVVAAGSNTGARLPRYIAMLATRKLVLVAFDADEAGDDASEYWLKLLPNAKRLRPLAHDPNDMGLQGMDVWAWIRSAL